VIHDLPLPGLVTIVLDEERMSGAFGETEVEAPESTPAAPAVTTVALVHPATCTALAPARSALRGGIVKDGRKAHGDTYSEPAGRSLERRRAVWTARLR
jgi:hypothetical protein